MSDSRSTSIFSWHQTAALQLAVGLVLAFIAGLRLAGRDNDYLAYKAIYSELLSGQLGRYEWLFVKLSQFSGHVLHLEFTGFLVLCAIVATIPKFIAFRRYAENFWLALAGYVLIYWILHEMTQIRSGLALGFAALAFGLVQEKRWLLVAITYGAAVLFHNSLLIMAPFLIYPKLWRSAELKWPAVALVIMTVLFFGIRYLSTLAAVADHYVGNHGVGYGERLLSVRLVIVSAITAIGLWRLGDIQERSRPYVWMSAWASLLYVAFFWEAAYANRLFEMAGFFMLFWMGALRGWPGKVSVGLFLFYGAITMINYHRHQYLVPF